MSLPPIPLPGERVTLLPVDESHTDGLFATCQDPETWRYMTTRPMTSPDDVRAFIQAALAERDAGTGLPFTIWDQETGRIVGSTRFLDIVPAHRQAEIGWTWLDPSVWRTRVNTECKYLLLRHAFESLGLIRVQLKTDSRNERSQAAIERIGGVREGILRSHRILPDGYRRDSVYYSILDAEWPDVKSRLETMLSK